MRANAKIEAHFNSEDVIRAVWTADQKLEVEFATGTTYRYHEFPFEDFLGLLLATSKGKYFNYLIKNSSYPYEKVVG